MLTLEGLSHVYPNGTRALDAATLTIPTGMFGLLGPNGAGKSTLMRCVATLQTPTQGSIRFGDIDVLREPERLRAVLGYLPQDFGVYPRVSAQDLLEHLAVLKGISGRGARRDCVEALLRQVNLWEVRRKAVAGFSGGMRQRFGIAQALIGSPRLIIVDEPTAGLDPEERQRFNNLMAEIGESVVVILSTHIVDDVTDLCSNMAIMVGGRIVRLGEPGQLLTAIKGRIWHQVVDKEHIGEIRQRHAVISARLRGGRHEVRVVAEGDPGAGFAASEATLEDLYFATLSSERHAEPAPAAAPAASAAA
jgi:ABC-2 type transport system ATP-binding protein